MLIDREHGPMRSALIGATLGLAVLTKGTSFVFAPASCLIIGIQIIRSTRRRFLKPALIIAAFAILIPLGHWTRNYIVSGSTIGFKAASSIINESFAPTILASNVVRNFTIHFGTPSDSINKSLAKGIGNAHEWLGVDPQDRRSTYVKTPYEVKYTPGHEDSTPAGAHLALIILMLILSPPLQRLILDRVDEPPVFSFFTESDRRQSGNAPGEAPEVVIGINEPELTLRDSERGPTFDLIAYCDPYSVFARSDCVTRMGGFRGPIPPFVGWEAVAGLQPITGPFPQWDLPVVRWGYGPKTTLRFTGNGKPGRLEISFRRNNHVDQVLRILLNGKMLEEFEFDSTFQFHDLQIPLPTRKGENRIVFEYARQEEPDRLAVLFKEIRVLPESET